MLEHFFNLIYFWLHWVFVVVRGLFVILVASLVAEYVCRCWASVVAAHRLRSYGSWAQKLWWKGLVAP